MPHKTSSSRTQLKDFALGRIDQIRSLRNEGLSLRQIGAKVGLSHGSVGRILKSQEAGQVLKPSKPAIPKRPRKGQEALPDFQRVSNYEAKGLTVKDAWRDYAKGCAKPYVYTHFSTLYRKWLEDRVQLRNDQDGCPNSPLSDPEDCSADEDHFAEEYWRRKAHPRAAVHALSGYNCSLKVRNDELVSFDTGEERSFRKVTHGLQAIIFLGEGGFITIDAIKWCEAQGIAICVLDWHGELVSVTQPTPPNDVSVRRAQFLADKVAMARAVLHQKLASQRRIGKLSSRTFQSALAEAKLARTVDEVVRIEGRAALEYWSNWRFELKHKKRGWPSQWTRFEYRASLISGGPRHATHPVNAILNYAYTVAAAQLTRSLIAFGFDSTAGFLHADAQGRHSLTYDALELVRADIDARILPWVASHTWKRADFPVTPEGVVRLQPTLAAYVAQRALLEQPEIDHVMEWLKETLLPFPLVTSKGGGQHVAALAALHPAAAR
jgi:CRISPR-associated protein Cas1